MFDILDVVVVSGVFFEKFNNQIGQICGEGLPDLFASESDTTNNYPVLLKHSLPKENNLRKIRDKFTIIFHPTTQITITLP